DMNIIVILSLMIAVACFTMVSGLLIIILERTSFIGIMKALGATNLQIRNIFLHYSALILLKGLFWGNLIGLILVFVQKSTHLIHLDPTTYYVDYVPVDMNLPYIILIEVITSLLCFLAMILPCYIIANVKPVKAIKFD
ncbi:MAG: FtsX-like permease family protein, partial [Paraprevotella sp.]|nr:FtsX-like permease family protein [Paraprevotella sp.]